LVTLVGRYLKEEFVIPEGFFHKPSTIVVEAPNGFGKTTCALRLVDMLLIDPTIDYIYYMSFSHKTLERVVKELSKKYKVIYHKGIQTTCFNKDFLKELEKLGIPSYLVCSFCPYYQGKSHIVFNYVKEQLHNNEVGVIEPKLVEYINGEKICTYPFIKKLAFDPRTTRKPNLYYTKTLVITSPITTFITPVLIEFWENLRTGRLKPRKSIMIQDELDEIIFRPIHIRLEPLELTDYDKQYIEEMKKYKIRLDKLAKLYCKIRLFSLKNLVWIAIGEKETIYKIKNLLNKYKDELLKAIKYEKELANIVLEKGEPTNLFRVLETLYLLYKDPYPEYTMKTFQKEDKTLIFEEYNLPLKLLFDTEFPFKYFWKIGLTATFPKLISDFLQLYSIDNAKTLLRVNRIQGLYNNVFVWLFDFRTEDLKGISHNYALMSSLTSFPEYIEFLIRNYELNFFRKPKGLGIWLQNKKQFRLLSRFLSRFFDEMKEMEEKLPSSRIFRNNDLLILVSYCGSPIARGVDLPWIDISWSPFVNFPKLRPLGNFVVLDYEKTIARTVQAVMRAVRSPSPSRPKVIVIPQDLYSLMERFYFPEWFLYLPRREIFFKNVFY